MAESSRHKELKSHISSFFSDRGWQAQEEAQGSGWRADCLVEKDGRKAALEIELSSPSVNQIKKRAEVYKDAGIPSVWLVPKHDRFYNSSSIPIFTLEDIDGKEMVDIEGEAISLDTFLDALIDKRLIYRKTVLDKSKLGALVCFQTSCYHCDKEMSVWQGAVMGICVCGQMHSYVNEMPDDLFEQEMKKIWDPLYSPFGSPAFYKRRGTSIRPEPYYAAHCPSCNRVQGNFYLQQQMGSHLYPFLEEGGSTSCEVRYIDAEAISHRKIKKIQTEGYRFHWCLEQKAKKPISK